MQQLESSSHPPSQTGVNGGTMPAPPAVRGFLGRRRTGGDPRLGWDRYLGAGFGGALRIHQPGRMPRARLSTGRVPGREDSVQNPCGPLRRMGLPEGGLPRTERAGERICRAGGRRCVPAPRRDCHRGEVLHPAGSRRRPHEGFRDRHGRYHGPEARGGGAAEERRMAGLRAECSRCGHLRSGPQRRSSEGVGGAVPPVWPGPRRPMAIA